MGAPTGEPCGRLRADLHLHTNASDGTLGLAETARRAALAGLDCIAITDHDTVGPELNRPVQLSYGIELIAGIEIKADLFGFRGELLGYFVDPEHGGLSALTGSMKEARVERMRAMIARCNRLLGTEIRYEEVAARTQGSVGRPHLAAALVERNVAADLDLAFRQFLASNAPCYVPLPRPGCTEVIRSIRRAGGAAALAHPAFMDVSDWGGLLRELRRAGMAGIEVYYPYERSSTPVLAPPSMIREWAEGLDLIPTGGSDDHGPGSVKETLGAMHVPYASVEALAAVASSVA